MLRTVFMGTPEFAVPSLKALNSCSEIVGVYTQPDKKGGRGRRALLPAVKKEALKLKLPVFQPAQVRGDQEYEFFKELRPDLVLVVAYGQILKQRFLDIPRLGFVNVHSSLLPR